MFRIRSIIVQLGRSLRLAVGSAAGVAVDVGVELGVVVAVALAFELRVHAPLPRAARLGRRLLLGSLLAALLASQPPIPPLPSPPIGGCQPPPPVQPPDGRAVAVLLPLHSWGMLVRRPLPPHVLVPLPLPDRRYTSEFMKFFAASAREHVRTRGRHSIMRSLPALKIFFRLYDHFTVLSGSTSGESL